VTHLAGDVLDPAVVAAACAGAEVVYQALNAPYHRWDLFPALEDAVVAGARAAGARVVSFGNVYAYGKGEKTEVAPLSPCSKKGQIRARMIDKLDQCGLPVAHVRASDLFGPGMHGSALGDEVIGRAAAGLAPRGLGDLDAPHTWTYTRDAGATLARVGTDPAAFGRVWHVPSAPPLSFRDGAKALEAALGRPVAISATPAWVLWAIGWFRPEAGELLEMMYEFDRPFVVNDAITRAALGLGHTPFHVALAATVAAHAPSIAAVPKLAVSVAVLGLAGPWMAEKLVQFTVALLSDVGRFLH
jgi:nucleoside-diphosphate-sugar epimerase